MNTTGTIASFSTQVRRRVETALGEYLDTCQDGAVAQAARYMALGGGHRWRAMLVVATGAMFRRNAMTLCMPLACAIELFHASALLLDDLPSMDNARTRRGKPCAHLVFPQWAADMTPSYLLNAAYDMVFRNHLATSRQRIEAAKLLSRTAAELAKGQEMDLLLQPGFSREKDVLECCRLKTGVLFAAATGTAAITCGATPREIADVCEFGLDLGMGYQYLDDATDGRHSPTASAPDAGRCTAVTVLGVQGARLAGQELIRRGVSRLDSFGLHANRLRWIARQVSRA
jgi:geranylgeranyl pyrophosphate synthase